MRHLVQTTTLLTLAALLLAGCAWSGLEQPTPAPLTGGEERWYATRIGEQTIGYGHYRIVESAADTVRTESHTLLKLDIAGRTHEIRYAATATLSAGLSPRDYALTLDDGGDETQIRLTIAQETAHLVTTTGGRTTETEMTLQVAPELERVDLGGRVTHCLRMDMSGPDLPAMTTPRAHPTGSACRSPQMHEGGKR